METRQGARDGARRADRPRHHRGRRGGARGGEGPRPAASPPRRRSPSVEGQHSDLHVCGYELDVAGLHAARRARGLPRGPPGARRGDRRPARGARLRGRPHRPRGAQGGGPADRPPAHRRRGPRAPGEPGAPRRPRASRTRTRSSRSTSSPGAKAFVQRTRPTVEDAIDVIHAAGGVAIWAHPFWDLDDPQEVVDTIDALRATASTASRSSTPRTTRSRPSCCTRRAPSTAC